MPHPQPHPQGVAQSSAQTFTPQAQIDRQAALGRQLTLQAQQPARSGFGVLGQGLTSLAGGLTRSAATQAETANQQLSQGILKDIGAPGGGFAANAPSTLLGSPNPAHQDLAIKLMTSREASRAKVEAAQSVSQAKIEAARLKAQQPTPLQRNVKASLDPTRSQAERDAISLAVNKPLVSVDQKGQTEEAKILGGGRAKRFNTAEEEATQAGRDLANLEAINFASDDPNLFTGSFGVSANKFKTFVSTVLGVDVKGEASARIVQQGAGELIKAAIKVQGKNFSDADRKAAERILPGLEKSRAGIKISVGMMGRGLRHKINIQNIRRAYLRDPKNKRSLIGVHKVLQPAIDQYISQTRADLERLKTIAEAAKQPSPVAGMGIKELEALDPARLLADPVLRAHAADRWDELNNPSLVPAR